MFSCVHLSNVTVCVELTQQRILDNYKDMFMQLQFKQKTD